MCHTEQEEEGYRCQAEMVHVIVGLSGRCVCAREAACVGGWRVCDCGFKCKWGKDGV